MEKVSVYSIVKYDASYYQLWNRFVEAAKNSTFLFHRDFMEYHSDRFDDYSLMVYRGNKLVALLPANRKTKRFYSQQALAYEDLLLQSGISTRKVFEIFNGVKNFNKTNSKFLLFQYFYRNRLCSC